MTPLYCKRANWDPSAFCRPLRLSTLVYTTLAELLAFFNDLYLMTGSPTWSDLLL